jgi:hypothetical protein
MAHGADDLTQAARRKKAAPSFAPVLIAGNHAICMVGSSRMPVWRSVSFRARVSSRFVDFELGSFGGV